MLFLHQAQSIDMMCHRADVSQVHMSDMTPVTRPIRMCHMTPSCQSQSIDIELLMAKVILIHKDKDIAILDHYRPIALLNTIYQLLMLITTSRLRQLTEYYAVMEESRYGFLTHRDRSDMTHPNM